MIYIFSLLIFTIFEVQAQEVMSMLSQLNLKQNGDQQILPIKPVKCIGNVRDIPFAKDLPKCSAESQYKVISEHHPTLSIFLSCTKYVNCFNTIKEILAQKTGATVNILANYDWLKDQTNLKNILDIKNMANKSGQEINLLPNNTFMIGLENSEEIEYRLPIFLRDSGIFRKAGNRVQLAVLKKYSTGFGGDVGMVDAIRHCMDIDIKYTYATDEEYEAEKSKIEKNKYYWTNLKNLETRLSKKLATSREDIAAKTLPFIYKDQKKHYIVSNLSISEGGNFLALPNGMLGLGHMSYYEDNTYYSINPSDVTKSFFNENQVVETFEIPSFSGVGHIDEVFRILPVKNKKNSYTVFYASPISAIEQFHRYVSRAEPMDNDFLLVDLFISKADMDDENYRRYRLSEMVKVAESGEKIIYRSALEIQSALIKHGLDVTIKPVPVFFGGYESSGGIRMSGYDVPNPINGIYVNGVYLYPTQRIAKEMNGFHASLSNTVKSIFEISGQKIQSIDLTSYNEQAGSIHCATLQIHTDCK